MTFIEKKNRLIDLEAFNVNARYLYSALRDLMGSTDESMRQALQEGAHTLLSDVERDLSSLQSLVSQHTSRVIEGGPSV